jgi:hypothetical protein
VLGAILGIFSTTTMAVYTDEEHGYDRDGDSSETVVGVESQPTPTMELIHLIWDNLHNSTIRSIL